jgi:hypothetical protein
MEAQLDEIMYTGAKASVAYKVLVKMLGTKLKSFI